MSGKWYQEQLDALNVNGKQMDSQGSITLTAQDVSAAGIEDLDHLDVYNTKFITGGNRGVFKPVNLYSFGNKVYDGGDSIVSFWVEIDDAEKYTISTVGTHNRFRVWGANSKDIGAELSPPLRSIMENVTNPSYTYMNNGKYKYLLVQCSNEGVLPQKFLVDDGRKLAINGVYITTSEEFDALDARVEKIIGDIGVEFELGGLHRQTGQPLENNARLRTKEVLPDLIGKVNCLSSYEFFVYAYDKNNAYIGVWNGSAFATELVAVTSFNVNDVHSAFGYNFKIVLKKKDGTEMSISDKEGLTLIAYIDIAGHFRKYDSELDALSKDIKKFEHKCYTTDRNTALVKTYSGVIALYDELVLNNSDKITKNTLSHGSLSVAEYVITTGNWNSKQGVRKEDPIIQKPIVMITSGVHGYERSSVMSVYKFVKDLLENPFWESIVEQYEFRIIPIVCPSGYDSNSRRNSNDVNINRNFDYNWVKIADGYNNSGNSPGDQDETAIVTEWMKSHKDNVIILIDSHNSYKETEFAYIATPSNTDDLCLKTKNGFRKGISDVISYWKNDRRINSDNIIFCYTGTDDLGGMVSSYAFSIGITSAMVETSWNQANTGQHSNETISISAEAIGNAINRILMELQ